MNITRCPKLNFVFLRCVLVHSELQLSQDSIFKMLKRQAKSMYTRLLSCTYLTLWAFLSTWVFILSLLNFFNNMWKPKNGQQKSACGSSVAPVLFDLLMVHQSSQLLTPHHTSVLLPLLVPVYCSSQWQTAFSSTDHLFHLSSSFWPHSFLSILFLVLQLDKAHVISPRNTNWWVWSSTCLRWL